MWGNLPLGSASSFVIGHSSFRRSCAPKPPPKTFGLAVPSDRGQAGWQEETKALRSPIRNPNRRPDFSTPAAGTACSGMLDARRSDHATVHVIVHAIDSFCSRCGGTFASAPLRHSSFVIQAKPPLPTGPAGVPDPARSHFPLLPFALCLLPSPPSDCPLPLFSPACGGKPLTSSPQQAILSAGAARDTRTRNAVPRSRGVTTTFPPSPH